MTLNQAIETAKAKAAGNAKWTRAIERAAAGLQSGDICVTLFCNGYALVTTPTGQHMVNGVCDCTAAKHGHKECVHRVAKRLVEMAEEMEAAEQAARRCEVIIADIKDIAADIASTPRKQLIVEIKACWPPTWPPIYTECLARFGKSELEDLDDDSLRGVRMAIAA